MKLELANETKNNYKKKMNAEQNKKKSHEQNKSKRRW